VTLEEIVERQTRIEEDLRQLRILIGDLALVVMRIQRQLPDEEQRAALARGLRELLVQLEKP